MLAPKIQYGRFVVEVAAAAIVGGAVAAGLHWATALELNASTAVAGLGAIVTGGWIALGGVGAPKDINAPNVAMNGFMDSGRASQGAMMISQEALLQEQITFDMSKRKRPERARDGAVQDLQHRTAAWACVAAGVLAIAVAAIV